MLYITIIIILFIIIIIYYLLMNIQRECTATQEIYEYCASTELKALTSARVSLYEPSLFLEE